MAVSEDVLLERRGAVALLTLNRPERLNALSSAMTSGAARMLDDLCADPSVRALVLTGAGRGFCSGADLGGDTQLEKTGSRLPDHMREGVNRIVATLRNAPFPVVTAVNGAAAGAGVGLALAGDFLLASRSMSLLLSFARIGMSVDGGVSHFLPRLIGPQRALARAMLMEPIGAEEAVSLGLAYAVVPDETLLEEALALAERLAAGPPLAFRHMKRQLQDGWSVDLETALEREAQVQGELIGSQDVLEGITAYRQRRTPQFRGH